MNIYINSDFDMKNKSNVALWTKKANHLISTIEGNLKMFIKLRFFSCKGQEFT